MQLQHHPKVSTSLVFFRLFPSAFCPPSPSCCPTFSRLWHSSLLPPSSFFTAHLVHRPSLCSFLSLFDSVSLPCFSQLEALQLHRLCLSDAPLSINPSLDFSACLWPPSPHVRLGKEKKGRRRRREGARENNEGMNKLTNGEGNEKIRVLGKGGRRSAERRRKQKKHFRDDATVCLPPLTPYKFH